ncbi:hypothetical protein Moror_5510 [Moniliophthora roreri MCA 2997]|uniref:Uncharacterized protein n=1 Tax=Moniliophthora roreri (strain MCA 2997) TaxID=1381753 RepID=V2X353_MONRO|nr:hypothetical protein Moror_5510 [Moniliophthora roreri MCA 2997]KAI3602089.1 hypothetical protein WG66_000317 [Moniliophthora roreri]
MAPLPPLDGNFTSPIPVSETHDLSGWPLIIRIVLSLLLLSTLTFALWHWRFPCTSIQQLDEAIADIRSLIRVDGCYHVDIDLLRILPNMQHVRDDLDSLVNELSFLKQETYELEPKHTDIVSWLVFQWHQLYKIDALYWRLRNIRLKILAAIERENRRTRSLHQGTSSATQPQSLAELTHRNTPGSSD